MEIWYSLTVALKQSLFLFFFFAIQIMTRAAMTACCVVCARRLVRFCSLDIKYFPAESSARASSHGCQRES